MKMQSPDTDRSFAMADAADARPRSRRWLVIGIVLIVVAVGAALFFMKSGASKTAAATQATAATGKGTAQRVTVIVPGRSASSSTISATGTLAARRDMPVGVAGEGGRVTAVLAEQGQWVKAGQTLVVIDRSVQTQQAAQLRASITVAQADAALAQSNLDRARSLVGRGFVSKADLDSRIATRDAAVARVAVARAQLNESQALIGRLDVRAPASGLVLARSVEAGQIVSGGGGTPLFRIAREGELELQARLAEQDLTSLSVGRPAQVTPVGGTRTFNGRIWQLSPIIDPTSRQGLVRIALPYDPALRPGGFASVVITSGSVDQPLLPQSAVLADGKTNFVYIIGPDNVVVRRVVTVGEVTDGGVSIASGLNGTEQVVVSAGAFLNPGDKVIPERRSAAAAAAAASAR
ncbi:efflux RND transporter periplasmic adaptor subunit [Sphingomonas prati]|uniref:RND family efflux transporter MFP subunit n=1 Tax=Sphingomonas prati TaxID=1843237 RepID=A0A7W9F2V4_9SPHN|nr:efflux RND transporter periplasmic adaptor subunit [Sphingomonas prati]MBB5729199.1 RND family efflux transporter MFP subunit [Sphingomonas prati]GGE84334.1 hemolysin secretion protein D [Sphingomonas prati]